MAENPLRITAGQLGADGSVESPHIEFRPFRDLWTGFDDLVTNVVDLTRPAEIAEFGGGANPSLELLAAATHEAPFTVVDISESERSKAPPGVVYRCADLASDDANISQEFDLVFSRMLCEHVASGENFHRNTFAALKPGGVAIHFAPAITSAPFLLNRAIPEALGRKLVVTMWPKRATEGNHGKFPAVYSWCHGPTPRHLDRLKDIGFEPLAFFAGVGHAYYDKVPPLLWLEKRKMAFLLSRPTPYLTSYVISIHRIPLDS
jgi:SAM-dependent methyltransferase